MLTTKLFLLAVISVAVAADSSIVHVHIKVPHEGHYHQVASTTNDKPPVREPRSNKLIMPRAAPIVKPITPPMIPINKPPPPMNPINKPPPPMIPSNNRPLPPNNKPPPPLIPNNKPPAPIKPPSGPKPNSRPTTPSKTNRPIEIPEMPELPDMPDTPSPTTRQPNRHPMLIKKHAVHPHKRQ